MIKENLLQWQQACSLFHSDQHASCIKQLLELVDSGGARIYYDIGAVYASLGRHQDAIVSFSNAIHHDNYFAVAYFQRGVSQWALDDYQGAVISFSEAFRLMRDNHSIDYRQLGLDYQLFAFEILIDRGLCYVAMNEFNEAMSDWVEAQQWCVLEDHRDERYSPLAMERLIPSTNCIMSDLDKQPKLHYDLIDYSPFCVPLTLLFEPPEQKLQNANRVDYLGGGKLLVSNRHGIGGGGEAELAKSGHSTHLNATFNKNNSNSKHNTPNNGDNSRIKVDLLAVMNRLERMQSTTTSPSTLSAAHSQRTSNSPSFGSIKPNDSPILMTPHSDSQQPCGDIAQIPLPITQLPPASAPINFSDRSPGEMSQSLFESSLLSAGARRNSKYQRVKLKIHEPQRNETRALVISDYNGGCIQPFRLILERISGKFGVDLKRQSIALRYLDEDGEPISIADDEDLELAIASVCEGSALHLTLLVE